MCWALTTRISSNSWRSSTLYGGFQYTPVLSHVGATLLLQPPSHPEQVLGHGGERLDLLALRRPQAGGDGLLVHIQTTAPLMEDTHLKDLFYGCSIASRPVQRPSPDTLPGALPAGRGSNLWCTESLGSV